MLHQTLWQDCSLLAESCVEHPFVRQLQSGILPAAAYRRFVEQEPFFWHAWFRAFALAAAKARKLRHARKLHELMGDALAEMRTRRQASGDDEEQASPRAATRAYVDFLLRTAWSNESGEIVAALASCLRLEALLGDRLSDKISREHPYAEWIRHRTGERVHERAAKVENLLDSLAEDSPKIRDAYRYALTCRRASFSAALDDLR